MAGHRRKWLIASALLVIVASMTWLVTRSGPRVTLELAFVGYTNKTLVHSNVLSSHGPVSFTSIEQTAQVLATNCGAVPFKFNTKVSSLDYVTIDGVWVFRGTLAMPLGSNAPNVLEPGECGIIEISSRNFEYRWSTEVLARPYRLRDRMVLMGLEDD